MNTRSYGQYAIAVAIAVVGALWLGVPIGTLAVLGVVLACPLMMIVMMGGMHGGIRPDHHEPVHHEYGSVHRPGSRDDPSLH